MWPNLQETGDLVTFAEEILNGKPHFLWILPNAQVVGFRNGKSRKDYLVRGKLPIIEKSRRCKLLGKKPLLVCDSTSTATTFTTAAWQETFKIQKDPLSLDSEKVLRLLKCKVYDEVSYVEKAKTEFC